MTAESEKIFLNDFEKITKKVWVIGEIVPISSLLLSFCYVFLLQGFWWLNFCHRILKSFSLIVFFFPIEGFFYFSLFWKSFLGFYILRIKISWYFYRLIVKSMLFYLKWAESSQFMAYRKEWLLDYLHYLLSHGKKKLLRFQTLGFCRSNFWEQSSTEQRTSVELRLFFLR